MKFLCLLIVASLCVNVHGRNHKNDAPKARQQQPKSTGSNSNFDFRRPNSIVSSDAEQSVPILRNDQIMKNDGSYRYQYETGNGISGMEQGTGGVGVQGISSYVSPEGMPIQLSYTADETGYHPMGDHIPKTPDYVLRSLEYIRTHPFKVLKVSDVRPKLSTEIAPPLRTPAASSQILNYKPINFNRQSGLSKNQRQRKTSTSSRRNDLRRRF